VPHTPRLHWQTRSKNLIRTIPHRHKLGALRSSQKKLTHPRPRHHDVRPQCNGCWLLCATNSIDCRLGETQDKPSLGQSACARGARSSGLDATSSPHVLLSLSVDFYVTSRGTIAMALAPPLEGGSNDFPEKFT